MQSLTDLNTFGNQSLDIPDNRPSQVIFNRMPPLQPYDLIGDITSDLVYVTPGIDILQIINYQTANVRFRIRIISAGTPLLSGSTIEWLDFPQDLTLTVTGSEYLISGINTIEQWNAVKEFFWLLPANFANCPHWYLDVAVLYYNGALEEERVIDWEVYDPDHYWIAQLQETQSTLSCTGLKAKNLQSTQQVYIVLDCINIIGPLKKFECAMTAQTGDLSCTGQSITIKLMGPAPLTSTFVLSGGLNNGKDLLIEIDGAGSNPIYFTAPSGSTVTVDWGDGTSSSLNTIGVSQSLSKVYSSPGRRFVSVSGPITTFDLSQTGLKKVFNIPATITKLSFENIRGLEYMTPILPASVTDLSSCFRNTMIGNTIGSSIAQWDVSNVRYMDYMFSGLYFETGFSYYDGNTVFNTNLNNWNTVRVISTNGMFSYCPSYNQPMNNWNLSSLRMTQIMFAGCTNFNQNLSSWSLPLLEEMSYMFQDCENFNGEVNWTTPSLIVMFGVFSGCTDFNQPLNTWNISQVTNLGSVFKNCSAFNQDIGDWDTSSVTTFVGTFENATSFNQDLSSWDVSQLSNAASRQYFDTNTPAWTLPKPNFPV